MVFFMLGKNLRQVAPPIKNIACVIPIDWVLISVGYNSAIKLCKIGKIPAFLVHMVITITANGIQETLSKLDFKSWGCSVKWLKMAKAIIEEACKNCVIPNNTFGRNFLITNGVIPEIKISRDNLG